MTNPQKKKKNSEEVLKTWTNLKEIILAKFNQSNSDFQRQLNQIFISLISNDNIIIVPPNKHFAYEEILVEIKRFREKQEKLINELTAENWKLKRS